MVIPILHLKQRIMIQGTIKDYTISTLEELIEKAIPRNKSTKVSIHTNLNLHIIELKWDKKNKGTSKGSYLLYIRYINAFNKEIYKPMRSQFTKQTLWEILNYLYK